MSITTFRTITSLPLLALLLAPLAAVGATPIDETRPLRSGADVSVDNLKGEIIVRAWDREQIHIGGSLGEGVEKLEIEGEGDRIRITVRYPESGGWFGWGNRGGGQPSRLEISVPRRVELDLEGVSADIEVQGTEGEQLEVATVSGDIDVDATARRTDLATVSGDLDARVRGEGLEVESVSGDVAIHGDGVRRIEAESVSGDIDIQTGRIDAVGGSTVSGDFGLSAELAGRARVRIEALSGDVSLRLLGAPSARLKASSFSGSIRSPVGTVEKSEYGPGSSLETTIGDGEAEIGLETFSGSITVKFDD